MASPSQAAMGNIGFNFGGRNSANTGPGAMLLPTDSAGVVPQANWNNYDNFANGNAGTDVALNDDTGAATPVTISWTANDSWNNDDPAPAANAAGNDKLMNGEDKEGTAGTSAVYTFANVPASPTGFYDLIVYTASNNDGVRLNTKVGSKTFYTVGAHGYVGGSAATAAAPNSPAIPARTFVQAKNEIDPTFGGVPDLGNYVRFAGIAPDSSGNITLTATYISGGDGLGISAIQLINGTAAPVDTTPPVPLVTQVVPNNDSVLITFSEPLDASAADPAHFTISGGGSATAAAFLDPNNPVTVKLSTTGLTPGTAYTVTVNGVKDLALNAFNGTATFRTATRATGDLSGFTTTDGYQLNGGVTDVNGVLNMTTGVNGQTRSVFNTNVVNINKFTAQYVYTGKGAADGLAFVIQGDPRGPAALGGGGGALGFNGIANSVGLLINLYTGGGEPVGYKLSLDNSTGAYGPGVTFNSGNPILVTVSYDQSTTTFTYSFLDLVTGEAFSNAETADIKSIVGGDYAYVGFTAATGGANSVQTLQNFRFTTSPTGLGNVPVAIITQPSDTRVLAGTTAHFQVAVNEPATFQWFKGTTALDGQTSASLDIPNTSDADNNTTYHVVVTGAAGTTGNTVTSSDATLTVGHLTFLAGYLHYIRYPGASIADVEGDTSALVPDIDTLKTIAEVPTSNPNLDNFSDRLFGYIVPAVEGDYTFYYACDDGGDLFLSTDSDPANKVQIAHNATWSNQDEWVTDGNGNNPDNLAQKRSDLFLQTAQGAAAPVPIHLKAGVKYYIEADHNEGGGGDPSSITWTKFGDPAPTDGTVSVLTGNLIGADVLTGDTVHFTTQPADQSVTAGTKASFSVAVNNSIAFYQWQKAPSGSSTFTDIPGATSATYTTDFTALSDSGSKYRVVITIPGSSGTSTPATLTVTPSAVSATVTGAGSVGGQELGIEFSGLIDAATVVPANFSVSGGTIASVKHIVMTDGTKPISTVKITLAAPVTGTVTVGVVGSGLKDASGNTIAATTKSVTINQFAHQDIGTPGDPVNPGDTVAAGNGAFDVTSGGSDIYNSADGFHFVYEKIKGDFDLRARVDYVLPVNNWSAGAVMARDSLDAGSRQWHLKITPPSTVTTVDGGTGAGSFETNRRGTNNSPVIGWTGTSGDHSAAVYPGQYIRLTRTNTVFTAWRAHTDGTPTDADWVMVQQEDVSTIQVGTDDQGNPIGATLPDSMYVGLATTSHNNSVGPQFMTDVLYRDVALLGTVDTGGTGGGINLTVTSNANGTITLNWTGTGKLQSNTVIGTTTGWVDVPNGATSGVTITVPSTGNTFYRVQQTP
jgi:hypothetical protein